MEGESLPLQLDGVDAQMHQHPETVRLKDEGMRVQLDDASRHRGHGGDIAVSGGLQGDTGAHQTLCKHRIRDLGQRHQGAVEGGND